MHRLAAGILVTSALIIILAFSFILYAQLALDYSLENLRLALEATEKEHPSQVDNRAYRSSLESLALEEITRENADLETVILLEHATRSIRDAAEKSGYTRAGVYIAEVLKGKVPQRNLFLRMTDAVFHFFKSLFERLRDLGSYLWRRLRAVPETSPFPGAGILILEAAERMEKGWKLQEAEGYYREFLDRYPGRPERGFVKVSLAHVLLKMKRFDEAKGILEQVEEEFPGTREEALAMSLGLRISTIQKRLARLPELENWVKSEPERIFSEEGGLELALSYLATYQVDRALSVLQKLAETKDPRVRAKAVFYQAWVYKWQGDLDRGKELFQWLGREPQMEEKLAVATAVQLAEVLHEKKEYREAAEQYELVSRRAAKAAWKALAELEQSEIYSFEIGNADLARQHLQELRQTLSKVSPRASPELLLAGKRMEEALERGLRDEGIGALLQGRIEIALEILKRYLKKFPRDGVAHSALASIYLIRGFLDQASEEAEKGYGFVRDEYTATVLGYVYEKKGKLADAERYYRIGMEIQPSYLPARFNLAWVYFVTERFKEADQLLAGLEKLKPKPAPLTWAKILNNRGCALWVLGKKGEATRRFKQALEVFPDFSEARSNLALAGGEKRVMARL